MVNYVNNKNKMIFYHKSHSLLLLMFAITSYSFLYFVITFQRPRGYVTFIYYKKILRVFFPGKKKIKCLYTRIKISSLFTFSPPLINDFWSNKIMFSVKYITVFFDKISNQISTSSHTTTYMYLFDFVVLI